MYALANPNNTNQYYTFQPSETGNGNVKVTYHNFPKVKYSGNARWTTRESAREKYRMLRRQGWAAV